MSSRVPLKLPLSLGKSILPSSPSKGHLEVIIECLDEEKGPFGNEKGLPFGRVPIIASAEGEGSRGLECPNPAVPPI